MLATEVHKTFYLSVTKLRPATVVIASGLQRTCGGLEADGQRCPQSAWGARSLADRYGKVGVGESARARGDAQGSGVCVCVCVRARGLRRRGLPSVLPREKGRKRMGAFLLACSLAVNLASSSSLSSSLLPLPLLSVVLCLFLTESLFFFFSNSFKRSVFSRCLIENPQGTPRRRDRVWGGKTMTDSHLVVTLAEAVLGVRESKSGPLPLSASPGQLCSLGGGFCGMICVCGIGGVLEDDRPSLSGILLGISFEILGKAYPLEPQCPPQ